MMKVIRFYRDGFRQMTVGRTLWMVMVLKAVIIFGILKFLFFPNFLESHFNNDQARSRFVLEQLTQPTPASALNPEGKDHD